MGIFSFLNKDNAVEQPITPPYHNNEQNAAPIPERLFIETDSAGARQPNNAVPEAADNNINLLFNFMDRNHEAKGYDDALINPDSIHLEQNLESLQNELERTINKVKTFYEDFIKEIDYHIST